jgi:hypothetical protein
MSTLKDQINTIVGFDGTKILANVSQFNLHNEIRFVYWSGTLSLFYPFHLNLDNHYYMTLVLFLN